MTMTQLHETIKVGSWIRFYSGGVLVIGVVEYLQKDLLGYWTAKTNIGPVDTRYVLEVRNEPNPPSHRTR